MATGITTRHTRTCRSRDGGRCNCSPTHQAHVWSGGDGRRIRRTFKTLSGARQWREDAVVALRRGELRAEGATTVRDAAEALLAGLRDGSVLTRSGERYKPSAIRGYEAALRRRLLPALGARKLSEVRIDDVQEIVNRMRAAGWEASTIRNAVMPLRVVYRRAKLGTNPTLGLELPAVRGRRDRIATPDEARELIAALPEDDRALWGTAFYGGLRRAELAALDWSQVDLAEGVIRVERSWDVVEGIIEPKSHAGRRSVPVPTLLRKHLAEHRLRQGRGGEGLVFGRTKDRPFVPTAPGVRAKRAWQAAGLEPIGLHSARHTYASFMIAAGIAAGTNPVAVAKQLSAFMGHSSISVTLDRYGKLFPGAETEAAKALDAYLDHG